MKKVFALILSVAVFSLLTAFVYASQPDKPAVTSNVDQEGEQSLKADSKPLNKNPEPVLKGNAGITLQSAYKATAASILDEKVLTEKNGEVQLTEYMTYAEFLKFSGEGEESKSAEIADDRMVFVVQVYYPDGFEHVKAGLIKNCLATGIYDAETGDYLGGTFETVKK